MIVFDGLFNSPTDTNAPLDDTSYAQQVESMLLGHGGSPRYAAYQYALSYTNCGVMPSVIGVACTDLVVSAYRQHLKIVIPGPDWYLDMLAFGIAPVLELGLVLTRPLICRCPWPEHLIEHVEHRIAERHPLYLNAKLKREYLAV